VDHEVEDDVDVEGARGEDAEAVGLEEHRLVEARGGGGDGGVEAFEVTDGDDALVCVREGDDAVGFFEGRGDRLFDEDVDVGGEEFFGDRGVVDGGYADGCGVEIEGPREEVFDGGEGGDVVLLRGGFAACGVGLDEGGELDEVRVGCF